MPIAAPRKLRALIRELGWTNAALYALDLLALAATGRRFLIRYHIVAQPITDRPAIATRSRGGSVEVRELGPVDPALADLPLTPEVVRSRFAQNSVCFAAFRNARIVGCLWLCLGAYLEDEVRARFEPAPRDRAVWDYDVYVRPEHRLGVVFIRLWEVASDYLRHRGYRWSVSRISAFNPRSLASHLRLGAIPCGSLTVLCAKRVQLSFSTYAPRVHLSLGPRSMPHYRIAAPGAKPR
jgi:hypothetical protein